jgi:hypothetical protein
VSAVPFSTLDEAVERAERAAISQREAIARMRLDPTDADDEDLFIGRTFHDPAPTRAERTTADVDVIVAYIASALAVVAAVVIVIGGRV